MLQNVKISRPDRLLQKRLIGLAYSLVALTAALILSIVFPQHLILLLGLTATITVFALALSLLTLKAGEKAISYGGFANEIIRLSSQAKRIDNSLGRVVIENDRAKELFGEGSILAFLQSRLSADNRNNPLAFQRLKNAFQNLSGEKVTLSLKSAKTPFSTGVSATLPTNTIWNRFSAKNDAASTTLPTICRSAFTSATAV